jgi:hypothetical protein
VSKDFIFETTIAFISWVSVATAILALHICVINISQSTGFATFLIGVVWLCVGGMQFTYLAEKHRVI